MLRADSADPEALLAAFTPAASRILEFSGPHRDYVQGRLLAILAANDLIQGQSGFR